MRILMAMASLLLLGACIGYGAAEGISTIITEKSLGDHAVSIYSGKDCSTVRIERGETYCAEDEVEPRILVYCYPTLGKVTCYDRPNPYNGRQRAVGNNDHNLIKGP